MNRFRNSIEIFFERLGHVICKNRIKVIFICLTVTLSLVSWLPKLHLDTSTETMLHKSDKSRLDYNKFKDQFGRSELILVTINPPEIFDEKFINTLNDFQKSIEDEVPYLKEVSSIINARRTVGEGDILIVGDLFKGWPEKKMDFAELEKEVMNNRFYRDHVISENGLYTAVIIETQAYASEASESSDIMNGFEDGKRIHDEESVNKEDKTYLSEKENAKVIDALSNVIKRYNSPDFPIAFTGGPVVINLFNKATEKDMEKLFLLSSLIIISFLALLFRNLSGVLFPIIIVEAALFSTLGLMAIFQSPLTTMSVVIPSFLLAVGVGDSVHILAVFYRKYNTCGDKESAICYAMGHSGLAVVMTSLTTAAGLLSFSMAELASISDMGIYAATGVFMALAYTIFLLPALLSLFPIKRKNSDIAKNRFFKMDKVLIFFADLSTGHPGKIIWTSIIMASIAIVFAVQLRYSDYIVSYFPDDHSVKKNLALIDREMKGTITLETVVDTGVVNGIYDPGVLTAIENISSRLKNYKTDELFVGKVFSINDILKETNRALHENDPSFYTIPLDKSLIAQELFLFENSGSDDLERIVDSQFSKTRVTVKTPWVDSVVYDSFVKQVEDMFRSEFAGRAEITVTGLSAIMASTIPAALHSMAESYVIAFIVISLMMFFLLGNIKLGFISMVPNLLPILLVMGLIKIVGLDLNLITLFIGSIAIGLVVDDTIHFMYNFEKYSEITGNIYEGIRETLLGTGRALLITSIVLCSNFFILMTATLKNSSKFGLFTGITIILALLADFLLAPALLTVFAKDSAYAQTEEKYEIPSVTAS